MITLPETRTHESIRDAIFAYTKANDLPQGGKWRFVFNKLVRLQSNRRNKSAFLKEHIRLIFFSRGGELCYTSRGRTGFAFTQDQLDNLVAIHPVLPPTTEEMHKKIRQWAGRIHPNAWSDLKSKMLADPQHYIDNCELVETNICSKFDWDDIEKIRQAFENKTTFSVRKDSSSDNERIGRDLKAEGRVCDDGIFRAWFSSEFPGCLNGDYWLLINPTTAIFKERD